MENCLFNHQLKQCVDSQSYRLATYCLHNHVMYVQGPGGQKCFLVTPPAAATFPPPEDPNPGQYPDTMALPSCPWASIYPQMPGRCYNPEQVSVCQIHGKTYWTGTIMQRKEITDQLCPKKSGSTCWQYNPGYRVNSPLDLSLYLVLNTTHHLLNDTNPQLAKDCWLCLSLGASLYLATPVLLIQQPRELL